MRERHEHTSLFTDSACERLVKKKRKENYGTPV